MIRREDLIEAIAECNGVRNPNADTCAMLASFYTILDHMQESEDEKFPPVRYSYQADEKEVIGYDSGTEFSDVVYGRSADEILPIIDELMTTLQVLNPKLYQGVLRKIAE